MSFFASEVVGWLLIVYVSVACPLFLQSFRLCIAVPPFQLAIRVSVCALFALTKPDTLSMQTSCSREPWCSCFQTQSLEMMHFKISFGRL